MLQNGRRVLVVAAVVKVDNKASSWHHPHAPDDVHPKPPKVYLTGNAPIQEEQREMVQLLVVKRVAQLTMHSLKRYCRSHGLNAMRSQAKPSHAMPCGTILCAI